MDTKSLMGAVARFLLAVVLVEGAASRSSQAADVTWNNGGTPALTWNTTSLSWSTGTWNNANNDGAIFGATGVGTITVATPINLRSLSFTTAGYTLGGAGTLNFTNAGTSTAGGSVITSTVAVTINTNINAAFGITKLGSGTLILGTNGASLNLGNVVSTNNDTLTGC